jgi:ubiquinone/menaquinone biosynthesis C-methylase UbiE
MPSEIEYVLGTHDAEIDRLELQHDVWRARATEAWTRAGFGRGQTIIDVGAGPGHAALDLSRCVGPNGQVLAVERSRRFLDALETRARIAGLTNVRAIEADLDHASLGDAVADGAWCRWVLAFVREPRDVVRRLARAIRPGGAVVIHEYFSYATWRVMPRSRLFEEFVALTMSSWRATGGEPDIGLDVPGWLSDVGFVIEHVAPMIDAVMASHPLWRWAMAFAAAGTRRLEDLGVITTERRAHLDREVARVVAAPDTRMLTPGVVEIVARRVARV